ncbi:MAG: hypothetical protein HY822_23335 [Acidobacteria bacterium]|nr:hypothetical protein [Acidobacteriota bacterium]
MILIAADNRVETFGSVDDVPEELRERLIESTTGARSARILIADRKGREAILEVLRRKARHGRGAAPRPAAGWLTTWGGILLAGAAGLALWLLLSWR